MHLTWCWIEGTTNAASIAAEILGFPEPDLAIPKIGDENYIDFGASYSFKEHITLRAGINNLFDSDPPLMADAAFNNNTDTLVSTSSGVRRPPSRAWFFSDPPNREEC